MSDPTKVQSGLPQPQGMNEDPLFWATKLFVRFLQVVFSNFEKGAYKWQPDLELTDIIIADQGMIKTAVVEKRPAIICMRGNAAWSNVAIDQFTGYDAQTGARSHTDLVSAAMFYNCIAPEGLEAQRIAWFCSYATRTLKRTLMKRGLHRVGEDVSVGAETDAGQLVPDTQTESRLVQVSVPFFFQDSWTVAPVNSLLLKDIDLSLASEGNSPASEPTVIRGPAMYGKALKNYSLVSLTQRVSGKSPLKK